MGQKLSACDCRKNNLEINKVHQPNPHALQPIGKNDTSNVRSKETYPTVLGYSTLTLTTERSICSDEDETVQTELSSSKSNKDTTDVISFKGKPMHENGTKNIPAPVVDSTNTSEPREEVIRNKNANKEEEEGPSLVITSTLRFTTFDLPGIRNKRFPCSTIPRSNSNSIQEKSSRNLSLTLPEHCNPQLCLTKTLRFAVLDFKK